MANLNIFVSDASSHYRSEADPARTFARYRLGSAAFISEGSQGQSSGGAHLGHGHTGMIAENDFNGQSMLVENGSVSYHGKARRALVSGVSFYVDDPNFCNLLRMRVARVLDSSHFEIVVGVVVLANALMIGLELSLRMDGVEAQDMKILGLIDKCFLGVYVMELCLRFFVMHFACLKDHWVKFDATIVVCGAVSEIMPASSEGLGVLAVLRMARLLRLVRAIRLLAAFRDLFVLVRGLLDSAGTVFYTLLLLVGILYVFACVGVELIGARVIVSGVEQSPLFQEITVQHFRSVPIAMLTLVQFVCLDSIAAIYSPLVSEDPILGIYFMFMILVIGIVLMNLITAVVVNSALEQATHDKESQRIKETDKKKRLVRNLRKMFSRLDEDGDCRITPLEITNMAGDDSAMIRRLLGMTDPLEIYAALDIEGKGSLDLDEFCDGIWQVAISEAPIELKRLEKMVTSIMHKLSQLDTTSLGQWATTLNHREKQKCHEETREVKLLHPEAGKRAADEPATVETAVADLWMEPPPWAQEQALELRRLVEATERVVSEASARSRQPVSPELPRQHSFSLATALALLPDEPHRSVTSSRPVWIRVTDSAEVYTRDPFENRAPTVPSGPFKPPSPPRTVSPRSAPDLDVRRSSSPLGQQSAPSKVPSLHGIAGGIPSAEV